MGLSNNLWEQIGVLVYPTRSRPGRVHLDAEKSQVLSQEVVNPLLQKKAIQSVPEDREGYSLSQSDDSWSPAINLKSLNRYVVTVVLVISKWNQSGQ